MRTSLFTHGFAIGAIAALLAASQTFAADPATREARPANASLSQSKSVVIRSLPSKKLVGSNVQNNKNETVGSIEDIVVDLESGKVDYVALSVGGVLGIGDKLFAIPFRELHTSHDKNNNVVFTMNISKEKLEKAPGFDKNTWPDFASAQWRKEIDSYYGTDARDTNHSTTRESSRNVK
jgi:sporulation protein YlmC with PRC-barrel domain